MGLVFLRIHVRISFLCLLGLTTRIRIGMYRDSVLSGKSNHSQKLTFDAGTGDTPHDWYVIYSDPETNLLSTAAYIITAGQSKESAEEDPNAISYSSYTMVKDVLLAERWDFYACRVDS